MCSFKHLVDSLLVRHGPVKYVTNALLRYAMKCHAILLVRLGMVTGSVVVLAFGRKVACVKGRRVEVLTERLNHPHYRPQPPSCPALSLSLSLLCIASCWIGLVRLHSLACYSLPVATFLHMHRHSIKIGSPDLFYACGGAFA